MSINNFYQLSDSHFGRNQCLGIVHCRFALFQNASSFPSKAAPMSSEDRDYESLVLHKLRQAEERKRLIEQMQKDDDES